MEEVQKLIQPLPDQMKDLTEQVRIQEENFGDAIEDINSQIERNQSIEQWGRSIPPSGSVPPPGNHTSSNASLTKTHLEAAKKTLRYLKQTMNTGITFTAKADLLGYCDSDWAGDLDKRKSTTGYIFTLSGGPISWKSRQPTVARQ